MNQDSELKDRVFSSFSALLLTHFVMWVRLCLQGHKIVWCKSLGKLAKSGLNSQCAWTAEKKDLGFCSKIDTNLKFYKQSAIRKKNW